VSPKSFVTWLPIDLSTSLRHGHAGSPARPKIFTRSATWEELADHCERLHPAACEEIAGMGPGEVMELRQRMAMVNVAL
jgi:hypothetical protein